MFFLILGLAQELLEYQTQSRFHRIKIKEKLELMKLLYSENSNYFKNKLQIKNRAQLNESCTRC
jgi:hypothetical protein